MLVLYGYICAKEFGILVDEGLGVVNAGTALIHVFVDVCRRTTTYTDESITVIAMV